MKTIPAAEKKFKDLAIGDAFYLIDISEKKPFIKVSQGQAEEATDVARTTGVKRTIDIDFPDDFTVRTPAKHPIFDGRDRVMVDACCDGSVKLVEVIEARAWPNLVEAPKSVESVLACMQCGRLLHTIQKREDYEPKQQDGK